jgi:hypothetical protein
VSKRLPLIALLVAALLLASCLKTGRPSTSPNPAPNPVPKPVPAPQVPQPEAPTRTVPARRAEGGGPGGLTGSPPPASAGQKGVANAATLLALGRERRIMPEDFKIGQLGDEKTEKKDEGRALAAAHAFLDRLVAGSVDKTLLTPESQDTVADTLTYGLRRGDVPVSFRLGAPKSRDNGEITAEVRLFGKEGSTEGEIYVASAGSQWLVADVQLSLAQLSIKTSRPKEKFFPLEYRWLLEE